MLDQYHFGEVKRLNPESPMPLINITWSETRLWGSANVAANIVSLGASCALIWNIGKDWNADIIATNCKSSGIDLYPIITDQSTITKVRYIETTYNQQVLRADFEEYVTITQDQIRNILDTIQEINPDIIVCSDYSKWMLSSDLIKALCGSFSDKKLLVDTKPIKVENYSHMYVLKPNFKEFKEMIGLNIENTSERIIEHARNLLQTLQVENIIVTRGKEWAIIISHNGSVSSLSTQAQKVFDVSWAGDTFLAGMAVKLNEWLSLSDAVIYGNKASGVAVGKVGTSVVYKHEVI